MPLDEDIKSYVDDSLRRNLDEIRLYHQQQAHFIHPVMPPNTVGVDGHLHILSGPTKKLIVKIGGAWYGAIVS